jgi:hypothetical protein
VIYLTNNYYLQLYAYEEQGTAQGMDVTRAGDGVFTPPTHLSNPGLETHPRLEALGKFFFLLFLVFYLTNNY